jgi:3-deoxy-7-phosphoheptulonate synthase
MIYIKENETDGQNINFENFPKVGIYYVLPDTIENKLVSTLKYKKVPDDIKFPACWKTDKGQIKNVDFAGTDLINEFTVIAGPCSAETENQIQQSVQYVKSQGLKFFRAGCYKPRTNAYSFQGLGEAGLKLCKASCKEAGLKFVSEVKDLSNLENVYEYADVVQVGSKCMYDVGVLKALGKTQKPILLKRHFGATLKEFAQAADFIVAEGNNNVVLCERGVRTFETSTRFSLDSCGIEWMKRHIDLPIIGDPSHAMGYDYGVEGLSLGMIAQGVNGLIIEVHPDPEQAKSDASQQLDFNHFSKSLSKIKRTAEFFNGII